ncbi:G-protein coupled receptor family C group 6 member A-like [Clytia hemisphaerica]|uniref:G-protein coupled receptor family C group 6 member A-like n=1 Tax=Clytia hemisphaerica TaxID=252671 RepID=UPI0034D64C18
MGVGSACYSISTNQTKVFNDQARIHDKAIRYFITQNEQVNPGNKLFQYQHYDVCNSNDVLLDLLVDLLLNDTFTVLKNPSNKVGYPVPDWKYESKILVLLVYLNRQQFQLLVEVLSQTNILIMNLRESISLHYNEYLLSSQWISDASIKNFGRYFKAMLQGLNCKYVTMVLLRKNPYHFELYRNILLNHQICLNIEIINKEDNVQDVIQKLRQDDQNGLIILLGDEDKQTRLLNNYGPSNQTWFVNENYSKNISSELGNVISFRDNTIMKYSSNMKGLTNFIMRSNLTNSLSELDYFSRLFKEINLITAFIKDELTIKNKIQNLKDFLEKIFPAKLIGVQKLGIVSLFSRTVYHRVSVGQKVAVKGKSILKYLLYTPSQYIVEQIGKYSKENICPQVVCQPGNEYLYTKLADNTTDWDTTYRWTCQLCAQGFYKPHQGNTTCNKCPHDYLSSEKRDSCYDPYISRTHSLKSPFVVFATILTSFGLCSCVFVFVEFFKYRATPMMKAADVSMTYAHLIIIALNFVLLFLSYYGAPNILKCHFRMISFTVSYTIIVGIILLRAQQVLKAFQSRVKMTKSEIRKSRATDVFLMLVIVVANNLILIVLLQTKPLMIRTLIQKRLFLKTSYCGTGSSQNVLIAFAICLHITCFVQAFRGRRLPGAFKETMPIVYGNFIAIVVFIILYPIVFFQKDILQKEAVYWLAITLNMNVLIIFCYFRRIYFAIFRPEINTVEYSRAIVLAKMKKDSNLRVPK